MKYLITKANLKKPDGWVKVLKLNIPTNNIEAERAKIKQEYKCEKVLLTFSEVENLY